MRTLVPHTSVTGGARNFTVPQRLLETIKQGLGKAVLETDAWIVTGGTHAGVMQLMGEIMSDLVTDKQIPLIGVATWGIIKDRDSLTVDDLDKRLDISYSSDDALSLDLNHNFFVLVDDGSSNQFGKEIEFRAKLERQIAQSLSQELKIPIVSIIVQGGPGSLNTAYSAVVSDTPLVSRLGKQKKKEKKDKDDTWSCLIFHCCTCR